MVERFFAEITQNRIRRGAFKSVANSRAPSWSTWKTIMPNPKPFIWTKSAGEILEKVAQAKQVLESQHQEGAPKSAAGVRSVPLSDQLVSFRGQTRRRRPERPL
jgi:hypothetical protein